MLVPLPFRCFAANSVPTRSMTKQQERKNTATPKMREGVHGTSWSCVAPGRAWLVYLAAFFALCFAIRRPVPRILRPLFLASLICLREVSFFSCSSAKGEGL